MTQEYAAQDETTYRSGDSIDVAADRGGGLPRETDFEGSLSGEMRLALHDFVQAATVAEWCADECIGLGPEMDECARLCRDVASLASLNVTLLARDSPFGTDLAATFARAAAECADECSAHDHAHCQECARVLDRAVDSTWDMIEGIERSRLPPR